MVKIANKGQVSLEYLMTYGIAIAIVVIAVAALYSMGVFSPSSSTVACSPCFSNFAFVDYAENDTIGKLMIKNGPKDLEYVNCTYDNNATACDIPTDISANEQVQINLTNPSGNKKVKITYTDKLSKLQHTDEATIHSKY